MANSNSKTVEEYIQELPEYRRETIKEMRQLILDNIPEGYDETISWGMINYEIPLEKYPDTYNNQPLTYVGLSARDNDNALYLMAVYQDEDLQDWLEEQFEKENKEMHMDRTALKFHNINDLPLEAIAEIISRFSPDDYIEAYEEKRK